MRLELDINPQYTSAVVDLIPILKEVQLIVRVIELKIQSLDTYFQLLDSALNRLTKN